VNQDSNQLKHIFGGLFRIVHQMLHLVRPHIYLFWEREMVIDLTALEGT
jgi:hypothetical protein